MSESPDHQPTAEQAHELDLLREQIRSLRSQISTINDEKEALFQKKKELVSKRTTVVKEIKDFRSQRDGLTTTVKELKTARTTLNQQIKDKIAHIKDLQQKKDELVIKLNIKEDPLKIRRQIEHLNMRVETEALSFEKEKEVMKAIRDLRKKYDSAKEVGTLLEEITKVSREIDELKTQANAEHRQIQTQASESQHKHEHMLEAVKGIDSLRKDEGDLETQITEKKTKIKELSTQMEELLNKEAKILGVEREVQQEKKRQTQQSMQKKLADKQAEVSAKLKGKKTLTMEDLLILQGMDLDKEDLGIEKTEAN